MQKKDQRYLKNQIENLKDYNIPNNEKYKINKIENLYNSRNYIIKIFDDYNLMQKGKGLKILTPNLAQVKTGNNSDSLLNEIR